MSESNQAQIGLMQLMSIGSGLKKLKEGASCYEEVARKMANHLYKSLLDDKTEERIASLVRLYKTLPYGSLNDELRAVTDNMLDGVEATDEMSCLVLMGTAGDKSDWNDRKKSFGHRCIPLPSKETILKIPMLSRLFTQLGFSFDQVVDPAPIILEEKDTQYNVFHVETAVGSRYIPAQDEFVKPHKIQSVVGYGGHYPDGSLYCVIVFAKRLISRETAVNFKAMSPATKLATLSLYEKNLFT